MSFRFKKDFCLWLVPSNDGRVRKIRFSMRRALVIGSAAALLVCGVVFVASDYTRVQMLRARHVFSIKRLSREQRQLEARKDSLEAELKDLKSINSKVLAYEDSIRERLSELSALMGVASKMGVIPTEPGELSAIESTGGRGGAEIDCGEGSRCSPDSGPSGQSDEDISKLSVTRKLIEGPDESLIAQIDALTEVLNRTPLGAPGNGHVSSHYGYRRSPFSRRIRMHQGIDFSLPHGSEVVATADGVVKAVRRDSTYGLLVDVRHSDRVVTRYAHLSRASVEVGDEVCRGQAVGLVGSTGRSTGPHLHYEVRVNKEPLNPLQLMQLARALDEVL